MLEVHPNQKAALYAFTLFITLSVLAVFYADYTKQSSNLHLKQEFHNRTERITEQLQRQVISYEHGVRGTRSALLAGGISNMSLADFRMIMSSRDPAIEFPGIRGFGYIERVTHDSVEQFLEKSAKQGRVDFAIKQLTPHEGEHYVIKYIEPEINNVQAVGLDVASEQNRRAAMQEAMRTGKSVLTQPITLVQAEGKVKHGFLMLLPIYPGHDVSRDPEIRFQQAVGAAYAPIVIDEVLDPILHQQPFNLTISVLNGNQKSQFYEHGLSHDASELASVQSVEILGQIWQLEYAPTASFFEAFNNPSYTKILSSGLVLALIFSLIVYREFIHRATLYSQATTLRMLMRHTPIPISLFNQNMTPVVQTEQWIERFVSKRDAKNVEENLPSRFIDQSDFQNAFSGKSIDKKIQHYSDKDKQSFLYRVVMEPWFSHGEVGGVIVIAQDITALSKAQDDLESTNRSLEIQIEERTQALEASIREVKVLAQAIDSQLMYSLTDKNGVIQKVNKNFCDNVGYAAAELIGSKHTLIDSGHHEAAFWQELWNEIIHGKPWRNQVCNRTKSGRLIWWDTVVFPVLDHDGNVLSFVSISQDITDSHQMRDALEVAVKEANKANIAKTQFLSTMSHEIRTPLNAMIGMLYLLKRTRLDEQQAQQVHNIGIASETLLLLINDILDFSKIEAGELRLESSHVDLERVFNELNVLFSGQAESKQLKFDINAPVDALPSQLLGDSTRLKQMLVNLLSNAIKFTATGKVSLNVSEIKRDNQTITLVFEVVDTGVGISKHAQSTIFDSFTQADNSTTRKFGGTGLGLSIVKKLALAMGGDVDVSSSLGFGSTFRLSLNFAYSDDDVSQVSALPFSHRLNVLVAIKYLDERENLYSLLTQFGWQANVVSSGRELIEQGLEREKHFDVIISDATLPDITGFEALERMRSTLDDAMPISIITSDSVDLAEQYKHLADAVLIKPMNSLSLFNTVHQLIVADKTLVNRFWDTTVIDIDAFHWLDEMRLLVVDDNEMNLLVTRRILEAQGALVDTCDTGKAAIELLERHEYDAVLMDVQMPEMSGLEATEIIRRDLQLSLPILALTAGVSVEEKEQVFDMGMDDFLSKPVQPETLIRQLRKHIDRINDTYPVKMIDDASIVEEQPPQAEPIQIDSKGWPIFEGFDFSIMEPMVGGDLNRYRELLSLFIEQFKSVKQELNSAVANLDYHELTRIGHRLKGQVLIRAVDLDGLVEQLELAGKNKDKSVTQLANTFIEKYEKIVNEITEWLTQSS